MMYRQMLESLRYVISDRRFSNIADIVSASSDYSRFRFEAEDKNDIMYTGATPPSGFTDILPNPTHIPNLKAADGITVMGCTMGHHHDMSGEKRMQELYEFHGFGAMVIDHDGEHRVDFVFAKPGDKIAVPNHCNMTIYNLDAVPLNTLDFCDVRKDSPNYNAANKDMQKKSKGGIGPIFCIYRDKRGIVFKLNEAYICSDNELTLQYGSGVRVASYSHSDLGIRFDYSVDEGLGKRLYAALDGNTLHEQFRRVGVNLIPASDEVEIGKIKTREGLLKMLRREDRLLQRHFGIM